jgi:hypothetical protein
MVPQELMAMAIVDDVVRRTAEKGPRDSWVREERSRRALVRRVLHRAHLRGGDPAPVRPHAVAR